MSFIDLATLTFHRRNEMEVRINTFLEKCDHATREIVKLKMQAKGLLQLLNCDPVDLKTQFLAGMKQLDEYNYLITDFNLLVEKLHDSASSDITPVQDISYKPTPKQSNFNLMDALIGPAPSTSTICSNHCLPNKVPQRKIRREEQTLIAFSSQSCSSESVPQKQDQEIQTKLDVSSMTLKDTPLQDNFESVNLPAQEVLQSDKVYPATIMSIDGYSFWVITDSVDEVYQLMTDMTEYYKTHHTKLSQEDILKMTYCAFYDEESNGYYRGFFISVFKEESTKVEVFLVDTGEIRLGDVGNIQPLLPRFCLTSPHARCCHLAGVSLLDLPDKVEPFMQAYNGKLCNIEIDDNSSESLGVYVILPGDITLNELIVKEGLATRIIEKSLSVGKASSRSSHGPPELATNDDDDDNYTETEDALVAVTGYHNRDEIDLCKHYKGGPEKTCYKGARCKKRHVLIHPDGWTMDRVEVVAKCKSLPLPAPNTWHKVHVTCVYHFDRVYVQYIHPKAKETTVPEFGVVLPPTNLEALVRDMNCSATRLAYKPLRLSPAPGELVAAIYPLDEQWYRARVLSLSRPDQTVEVIFIDYGNVLSVKENQVRHLEERFVSLPMQAIRCVLGGVTSNSSDSRQWAAAKKHLSDMTLTNVFDMHVLGREYDELIVKLIDRDGFDMAQLLAAKGFVNFTECNIVDDTKIIRKTVPA